jgi:hypothetical protein
MSTTYNFFLNKFKNLFYKDDNNLITTHCNLSIIFYLNLNIDELYKKFNPIENFVENIDFYKLSIQNQCKILKSYEDIQIKQSDIILYFVNKITSTKINIRITKNIFEINMSNRKRINIDFNDIINIMTKIIEINNINIVDVIDINVNRIQSYFETDTNLICDGFCQFLIKNKIIYDVSNCINKSINIKTNRNDIYIFKNSVLINCDTYHDMVDIYDYINILIDEYLIENKINNEQNYLINFGKFSEFNEIREFYC